MTEAPEQLTGIVERFLFHNNDNGYTVLVLQAKASTVTVTGTFASLHPGEQVTLIGSWKMHPKFGKQFQAASCATQLPTTLVGLKKYLGSGLIKGIGKTYAEKMVTRFGDKVLEIIDQQPHRLQEIDGLGPARIEKIVTAWQSQKGISSIMVFLQSKGVSPAYATKIFKKYGHESVAAVQENPYRLADEVWGIGFKIADQIAQNMGFELHSIKRYKAGLVFSISQALNQGHLYKELEELKHHTLTLLAPEPDNPKQDYPAQHNAEQTGPENTQSAQEQPGQTESEQATPEHTKCADHGKIMKHALHELYEEGKIKLLSQGDKHFVTLAQYYFIEKGIAQRFKTLQEHRTTHTFDINAIYQTLRAPQSGAVELNEDQQRGILSCLQHKVTIITGGPGTGKTTLIKTMLDILDKHQIVYKLAAPTGRAAKRIMEGTKRYAMTIHRLLEFDASTMKFVHHENNALKLEFLIIDEASMIDVFLAQAIIKALPLDAHLVLIGDVDQLPSVGPGSFLKDLIASGTVPTIRLTHIFRQAQDSLIVVNAHRVNAGQFPTSYLPDTKKDFIFIKEDKPENVLGHLTTIFQATLNKFGIPADQAIVLCPMHRGAAGTQKINHDLQALLNPPTGPCLIRTGTTYTVNDRVMQLKNNYDKHVFNGDIGTVEAIAPDDQTMVVNFDERRVEYDSDELDELVLAYAISIHKSQGSEYPAVIIPIFTSHFALLERNLLYTAITRAKKLCIVLGQTKAIAIAMTTVKGNIRQTFLKEFLTTELEAR